MTLRQIAETMADTLREKKFIEAQTAFYHQDVFSLEPEGHPAPRTKGKTQLLRKEMQFLDAVKEWHAFEVSEPLVSKSHFSLRMYSNMTLVDGRTLEIDEIIVYEVVGDKIISERYFYSTE